MILITLALVGCDVLGGDEPDPPPVEEYLTARLNGEPWEGEPRVVLTGRNLLDVSAHNPDEERFPYAEHISLTVPFEGAGTYSLVGELGGDGMLYGGRLFEVDGDAIIATYPTTDGAENQLTIAAYDSTSGVMEGRFAATFVVDPDNAQHPLRRLPDTLRVTDGRFRVVVSDYREE